MKALGKTGSKFLERHKLDNWETQLKEVRSALFSKRLAFLLHNPNRALASIAELNSLVQSEAENSLGCGFLLDLDRDLVLSIDGYPPPNTWFLFARICHLKPHLTLREKRKRAIRGTLFRGTKGGWKLPGQQDP